MIWNFEVNPKILLGVNERKLFIKFKSAMTTLKGRWNCISTMTMLEEGGTGTVHGEKIIKRNKLFKKYIYFF